jgi:hypothetical protein
VLIIMMMIIIKSSGASVKGGFFGLAGLLPQGQSSGMERM